MDIDTTRFGPLAIDPETVITFPRGLAGLESNRRFMLLHEGETPVVHYLQSLDDADIGLPVTEPARAGLAYAIELDDAETALLELDDPSGALVLLILYRDGGGDRLPDGEVRGNLYAPLVINVARRIGLQKVLERPQTLTLIRAGGTVA